MEWKPKPADRKHNNKTDIDFLYEQIQTG